MDATAANTLAAGGEWLSETLDVLFGKRDVYPGAVVLPNRSAGDAFVWYSKLFSYLYRFATVWLDTMHWLPQHVRMGMKIDLVSSNFQASNCLVYEGLDEVLRIESRKGFVRQQCEIALRSFS